MIYICNVTSGLSSSIPRGFVLFTFCLPISAVELEVNHRLIILESLRQCKPSTAPILFQKNSKKYYLKDLVLCELTHLICHRGVSLSCSMQLPMLDTC